MSCNNIKPNIKHTQCFTEIKDEIIYVIKDGKLYLDNELFMYITQIQEKYSWTQITGIRVSDNKYINGTEQTLNLYTYNVKQL